MGGNQSSSAITQENNVTFVNKSTVEFMNQMINKTTSDTIVNQATSCGASSSTTLMALFSDIIAKGDINIDNTLNNKVSVNISCVNSSTVGTEVGSQVSNDLTGQIATAFANLAQQAAQGQADALTKTSINPFDVLMRNSSDSNVKQYNTASTTNDSKTVVSSMIKNITATTFTTNLMNELKASVVAQMAVTFKNLQAGGNVNITNLMNNTSEIIAQQVIQMNIGNQVTSKLLQTFNVGVKTEAQNTATQTAKAESTATTLSTGIAGIIDSIFGGVANIFGSIFGGYFGICCAILCCCCIISVLSAVAARLGGAGAIKGVAKSSKSSRKMDMDDMGDAEGGFWR